MSNDISLVSCVNPLYNESYQCKNNFSGNREIAIKRDNYSCVKCGMTRIEHLKRFGKDITVDHIDGKGSLTPKELKNNSLDNLQTLCLSCHCKKDLKSPGCNGGRNKWTWTKDTTRNNPGNMKGKSWKIINGVRHYITK